ncbi:hypothetical protein KIL84_021799 [Mauremys mutica]|uniref:Uncharacterized protein n=1 Tax=Mauremys mutica TaxID=74926 RepID=A0A9D3XGF3_9SAUR|nr:hypothetical protein KIL84_021799 [Mauremys mutica]
MLPRGQAGPTAICGCSRSKLVWPWDERQQRGGSAFLRGRSCLGLSPELLSTRSVMGRGQICSFEGLALILQEWQLQSIAGSSLVQATWPQQKEGPQGACSYFHRWRNRPYPSGRSEITELCSTWS